MSSTLARRALGPRATHAPASTAARQRLVDRVKLVLATDVARRWTLIRDRMLGRVLGRAIAHEAGHFLFASSAHPPAG